MGSTHFEQATSTQPACGTPQLRAQGTPSPTARCDAAAPAAPAHDLDAFIQTLPKAELHLHIEGTLEPELMQKLAARNGLPFPYKDVAAARAARATFSGLQNFLDLYIAGMQVLQTEEDFYDLADAYLARAASEGVRHAEIMFDPQGHTTRGVAFPVLFAGLRRAVEEAPDKHGLTASLIMCFMRDLGPESAAETLEQALPHLDHIVGVGLDSTEQGWPPHLFTDVFKRAAELGLRRMAHAGEEGGPENIWSVVKDLGVDRIDHGVRCLDDPQLVAHLAASGAPLTVCPLSNLCLQVYRGCLEDKLRQLACDSGITITVNSDDPAYFLTAPQSGAYINANYSYLARVAGLGARQLAELAAASFRASFLEDATKQRHIDAVWAALAEWEAASHCGSQCGR